MPDVASHSDVQTLDNFIAGRWVPSRTTEFFDVHNPAVGDLIGRTPLSTAGDVDAAVQAATRAFPAWRDTTGECAGRRSSTNTRRSSNSTSRSSPVSSPPSTGRRSTKRAAACAAASNAWRWRAARRR